MVLTWPLSACPYPVTAFLISRGAVVEKRPGALGDGDQDRAPHLAQGDGRLDVLGVKRIFEGDFVGLEFHDQGVDAAT